MGLKRSIGLFSLTNIVIANMIGAGIFTTTGIIMNYIPSPVWLIILWSVGGIIALFGALSYGELGANYPKAGGEYIYLSEVFHPLLGFLSGWVSFIVGFSAPIAASSIGVSEYLSRLLPLSDEVFSIVLIKKGLAVFIILVFTLIHIKGLKGGARVQNVLTVMKVVIILLMIFLGFTYGKGDMGHFSTSSMVGAPLKLEAIVLPLLWISFAYSGWNASSYIGSEIKDVKHNLPLSLILGTAFVILLYLSLNFLFVYAIPPEKMKGVVSIGGLAINELFGASLDNIFSLFIAFALLSSVSAFIIIGPRVYYAMAENGHFFNIASYINKNSVPSKSIIIQSTLAMIYVISGTFEQILTFLGIALSIFPIITVIAVFKMRIKRNPVVKIPGYPYTQILFILLCAFILFGAFLNRPFTSILAIGVVLLGIPVFYFIKK